MNLLEESENIIIFKCKKESQELEEFLDEFNISGRLFRKLYKKGNIYRNGKALNKKELLKKGDLISLELEEEVSNIEAEDVELDIVYEDMDILVVNKEAGMVVHQTKSHQSGTLSNAIANYFKNNNIRMKIRLVNRLDMDTSGLLIIAKNPYAHQQMSLQFENDQVEKKYYTVVEGLVENEEGLIDLPIGRDEEKSIKKSVRANGQNALTSYRLIERLNNASLLEVQIFTGRSHQIRVHMNHIGHPIIGDSLYNKRSDLIDRQALHSYYLKIKKVRDKKEIDLYAKMPKDILDLIDKLK